MRTPLLVAALLLIPLFSGCLDLFGGEDDKKFSDPLSAHGFEVPEDLSGSVSAHDLNWPNFTGATLRILDHGAFGAFDNARELFENLTGAKVVQLSGDDTGSALQMAVLETGKPSHDVFYGIDNLLLSKAIEDQIFQPYKPLLAPRIDPDLVFFGAQAAAWHATPVDHGYIAVNVDADAAELRARNATIDTLFDLRQHPDLFVTQNPHTSTPGLGFMMVTILRFGEDDAYDWLDYWTELLRGPDGQKCTNDEVKVTNGWSEAYENHFTGGYGNASWNTAYVGGYPIVTSYTESPAYEAFFGADAATVAQVLLDEPRGAAFHQIQTMGVLRGTPNRAVAEAWIEFTLTDEFQELAAPDSAVYPVVPTISTQSV